jgi:hypothetical protein
MEAVGLELGTLPLLGQHTLETTSHLNAHGHFGQPRLWVRGGEQASKLTSRLNHRYRTYTLSLRSHRPSRPRLVDYVSKLLCKPTVALTCSLGRHLERNRIEPFFVALGVTSDERLYLCGCWHGYVLPRRNYHSALDPSNVIPCEPSQIFLTGK